MAKATKGQKEAKRRTVAKGVLAGKPRKTIAREAGCSPRHVERLAREPETQFLITEALRPHRERLNKLAEKAIAAISVALGAKTSDKQNHFIRLRAVERWGDLLEMAQGKPAEKTESGAGLVTWEEFVVLYRQRKESQREAKKDA